MKSIIKVLILKTLLFGFSVANGAAIAKDGNYELDTTHANIGFSVKHLGISNTIGRFNSFYGQLDLKANGDSSISFSIDAKSVDTNNKKRDAHLRNSDFFEVDTFPTIDFKSTSIDYDNDGNIKSITGDLDLHGVVNSVTFDVQTLGAKRFLGKYRAGFKAVTTINRSDFDMDRLLKVVSDQVAITVDIELIKR